MRAITIFCLVMSLCIGGGCCCLSRLLTSYDGPELFSKGGVPNLKAEFKDMAAGEISREPQSMLTGP